MPEQNPYARLPAVDAVLAECADLIADSGRPAVVAAVRDVIDEHRGRIASAPQRDVPAAPQVARQVRARLASQLQVGPRRVINAAGVVVHTNLGRAPLSDAAVQALVDAAGYCDLETDLETGRRGSRGAHVDDLLAIATGAEAALTVNSCAAALVLALAALAQGRQVPVSRGQLVEIGGSFRLPDIMAASGARLLEVGTTNRTRPSDYRAGDDVAALLTVHPSNFTQGGFVTQPSVAEVAAVAAERGVPHIHDAGAGLLVRRDAGPLAAEPTIAEDLAAGADLLLASGDKLLGGPQAGLIVGRADLVDRCRRHPLARAVRLDKLRLAALAATLRDLLAGRLPPVLEMLDGRPGLEERSASLAAAVSDATGARAQVVEVRTMIGGGSAPGVGVDGAGVRLELGTRPAGEIAAALRRWDPPVVTRVQQGAVLVDLRTVRPEDDAVVTDALIATLRSRATM